MSYHPDHHHRQSIRLRGYDYTSTGYYFVTICTHQRRWLFADQRRRSIAEHQWQALAHMDQVALDAWVVMSNHVHGIIIITGGASPTPGVAKTHPAILDNAAQQPFNVTPGSLGAIVRTYKSMVTRLINRIERTPGGVVWQRGYYERIVRDEAALHAIRRYIENNPRRGNA